MNYGPSRKMNAGEMMMKRSGASKSSPKGSTGNGKGGGKGGPKRMKPKGGK